MYGGAESVMRFGALSVQRIHALVHWENPGEEGVILVLGGRGLTYIDYLHIIGV